MIEDSSDDIMEAFRERASIMQFCGKVPEADAVKMAYYWAKQAFRLREMPQEAKDELRRTVAKVTNCCR